MITGNLKDKNNNPAYITINGMTADSNGNFSVAKARTEVGSAEQPKDLNSLIEEGTYYSSNFTNGSSALPSVIEVKKFSDNNVIQTQIDIETNEQYIRFLKNGTWTEWDDIVTKTELENSLSLLETAVINDDNWKIGVISTQDGVLVSSTSRAYSSVIPDTYGVKLPENWVGSFRYYKNNVMVGTSIEWNIPDVDGYLICEDTVKAIPTRVPITNDSVIVDKLDYDSVLIMVKKNDDSNITPEELIMLSTEVDILIRKNPEEETVPVTSAIDRDVMTGVSLTLKSIMNINYTNSNDEPVMYLWHDTEFNFYKSYSIKGHKEFIFKWDNVLEPKEYSMSIVNTGDILCVWRTEIYTTWQGSEIRKNPIILQKDNNYKALEIDFSTTGNLPPTAWVQSNGFTKDCINNTYYMVEYARPSVKEAYWWKITGDPSIVGNWSIIQTHVLSGQLNSGFKHYHGVQVDPFTGYIYACTGDDDTAAMVYVTKDNGATVELVHGPNEKECRLLNWIFTKEFIYWATDSGYANKHSLFKIARGEDGVMDYNTLGILYEFPFLGDSVSGIATYGTCYLKTLNCLLFLERADGGSSNGVPLYLYDLSTDMMHTVDTIKGSSSHNGFRVECATNYTNDNTVTVGFGYSLFGVSDNTNNNLLLDNNGSGYGLGNITMEFNRMSDDTYSVVYSTTR